MKKVVVLLILSMLYMSPSFGYPPEYPYYQSDNIMYYVFEGLIPLLFGHSSYLICDERREGADTLICFLCCG